MYTTHIELKYQIGKAHYGELLAHAERQRLAATALVARPRARRSGISEIRSAIAAGLLRAGSWLMPEVAPHGCASPG